MTPDRRHFLAAALAGAAGCGGTPAPKLPPDAARRRDEGAARRAELLRDAAKLTVPADATRTTPKPPADVLALLPELKPLMRVAVRLHPGWGVEPAGGAAKLGGAFDWPPDEPWPEDVATGLPLTPLLQIGAEAAPASAVFRPGTRLLQLFWTPMTAAPADAPRVLAVWRHRAHEAARSMPANDVALPDLVPIPCRLFPERVAEFPPPELVPAAIRPKLEAIPGYRDNLSAAPGTKLGGWPRWKGEPRPASCPVCRRLSDFFATVDSCEWDAATAERWRPEEERGADADGFRRPTGLRLGASGQGRVHLFVCRHCDGWPVTGVAEG